MMDANDISSNISQGTPGDPTRSHGAPSGTSPSRSGPSAAHLAAWATSGLMFLTGTPDLCFGPPGTLMEHLERIGSLFPELDIPGLLTERAAIANLSPRGTVSCGGASRILSTNDDWIAVSLPRPDDEALVPAWLECSPPVGDVWATVEREVARRNTADLMARAELLQMAVTRLGEQFIGYPDGPMRRPPVVQIPVTRPARLARSVGHSIDTSIDNAVVVDLSGLWAGPLCGHLLTKAGARVIKVESTRRPDGARSGPRDFFDLLNTDKECVALDFRSDIGALHDLIMRADVVIESSRPRAMAQLGLDPTSLIRSGGPQIWVSITAHGRDEGAMRIGFGDDTAVAGGLVVTDGDQPMFCGDAIADPLSGLTAAGECLGALSDGFSGILDVAMSAVAAACAGPTTTAPDNLIAADPRARATTGAARDLGADTATILTEFEIQR